MGDLADRLASLRASTDRSIKHKDTANTPFPLDKFLLLYTKGHKECFVEYMQGAKALYEWLAPLEFPDYPDIDCNFKIPPLLMGYDSQQVAGIVSEYRKNYDLALFHRAERAILISMYKDVLPELY